MRPATVLYAAFTIAAGVINLIWHDFATGWQPIQTFGDRVPGREFLAIVTALWLVAGGCAILWPRTAAIGGGAVACVYTIFAIFWLPRLYWIAHFFGFNPAQIIGVLAGAAQQVILASAGILIWASFSKDSTRRARAERFAWWAFGISCLFFGLSHYLGESSVAALVPKWLPAGGAFWAIATGTAFLLAGISIVTSVLDVLAARLLAVMLLVFSVVVCFPWIVHDPQGHEAWGGNAYNLTAAAASWILANSFSSRSAPVR